MTENQTPARTAAEIGEEMLTGGRRLARRQAYAGMFVRVAVEPGEVIIGSLIGYGPQILRIREHPGGKFREVASASVRGVWEIPHPPAEETPGPDDKVCGIHGVRTIARRCAACDAIGQATASRRDMPAWNCVDYPGGMHYTPGAVCLWCGKTRAAIAADDAAAKLAADDSREAAERAAFGYLAGLNIWAPSDIGMTIGEVAAQLRERGKVIFCKHPHGGDRAAIVGTETGWCHAGTGLHTCNPGAAPWDQTKAEPETEQIGTITVHPSPEMRAAVLRAAGLDHGEPAGFVPDGTGPYAFDIGGEALARRRPFPVYDVVAYLEGRELIALRPGQYQIRDLAYCGTCERAWDDTISTSSTPAPAGRCPFEAEHDDEDDDGYADAAAERGVQLPDDGTPAEALDLARWLHTGFAEAVPDSIASVAGELIDRADGTAGFLVESHGNVLRVIVEMASDEEIASVYCLGEPLGE